MRQKHNAAASRLIDLGAAVPVSMAHAVHNEWRPAGALWETAG